jgi:transcriptional regulator, lysR family
MINDINLNLYRVFYICAKCDSFVEASRKLYVSQPAVSKQIKNLEDLLGTKLFYRNNNGLRLTKDGKQLYDYIEKSYNYLMAAEKIIKENNNLEFGTIVIGAPAHIASFYLLEFIEKFQTKSPNIFF